MKRFGVVLAFCLLADGAAAQEAPKAPPAPTPLSQPQGDPGRDKPATQPQSSPPAPIIVNVQPPPRTEAEAQKEESERQEKAHLDRRLVELTGDLADYTRWLAYATAALFAVTAGLFAFAVMQTRDVRRAGREAERSADAAQEAVNVAKAALVASNRAWIRIEGSADQSSIFFDQYGRTHGSLSVKLLNVGNEPALDIQLHIFMMLPGEMTQSDVAAEVNRRCDSGAKSIFEVSFSLFPGDKIPPEGGYYFGLGADIEESKNGIYRYKNVEHINMWLYGYVSYLTASDKDQKRETRFLYHLMRADGKRVVAGEKLAAPALRLSDSTYSLGAHAS